MKTTDRLDDRQVDRLLAAALRHEADRVEATLPSSEVALARLANRLRLGRAGARALLGRPAVAWLAMLLLLAFAAIVVGTLLLRELPRTQIVVGPYGPPAPCGIVPVADGDPLHAFRDEAVLFVARSGLVTVLSGDPRDSPPAGEGGHRTRVEARFVTGVLTPAGIAMVLERVEALDLAPGCYRVRTRDGDSAIYANTEAGAIGINFSFGAGSGTTAAVVSPADEAALDTLLDSLFEPGAWAPPDAFTPLSPADLEWIVHATFRATGLKSDDVVDRGDGVVASADDGRHAGVRLPGGIAIEAFGSPIPGASNDGESAIIGGYADVRAANQRCGILGRADAMVLADSLDRVWLWAGVPDELAPDDLAPDFYTPDMATAVTVRLHPAVGSHATCEGFAAELNAAVQPSAEPSAAVVGDLAAIDPCSLAPADLRGKVELAPWYQSTSPFGIAARSCILEWHHSMTVGGAERILWLYPESLSEDEAHSLSTWIFGRATAGSVDGARVWLNDCMAERAEQFECRWAVTGFSRGHFVLLELEDRAATVEGTIADLGRILRAVAPR